MSAPNSFENRFIELFEVESTNNYAMGLAHEGMAHHGTAVFTTRQTKGKGQRTKQWLAEPAQNMAVSIIIEPGDLPLSRLFLLSMAAACAARDVFEQYAVDDTKIKWPNDIYWRDRKAAGILIENIVQANKWRYAVVGIGLNVNQVDFGPMQQQAVSLKQITGKEFDPATIAREIGAALEAYWQLIFSDPQKIERNYHQHLYKLNQKVKFKKDSRVFEAVVKSVTSNGQLVVEHGTEERFEVGEIEWVLQ